MKLHNNRKVKYQDTLNSILQSGDISFKMASNTIKGGFNYITLSKTIEHFWKDIQNGLVEYVGDTKSNTTTFKVGKDKRPIFIQNKQDSWKICELLEIYHQDYRG